MEISMRKISIFIICAFILAAGYFTITKYPKINKSNESNDKLVPIKSGNLSTDYSIDTALSDIDKFNLNTVNVPIAINIDDLSSNSMVIDEYSLAKAIDLIKILKKKEVNIILEPYPWIDNGSMYETDWDPSNIDEFFWNWKTVVLKPLIDEVAKPYDVDILNIGTGFDHMEYAHGYWLDLIDYVRKHYDGLITYRTSWWITASWDQDTFSDYQDKLNNPLFGELDFISIAAYFELTNNDTNSVNNLVKALNKSQIFERDQNIKKETKNFHIRWGKPIFFGELGFPRTTKASIHPWNPYASTTINSTEQANCFEAYRRVFEKEPWFMGFSIFAIGEDGDDKLYYPSNESTKIIRKWYNKSDI
ncbi:MAG: hydrolase [Epulopiscium sp.]|nr:hydrolase [Candidatus Epulonipiscium sp.]